VTPTTWRWSLLSAVLQSRPVAILGPVRLVPARIIETVSPSRLGHSFRWLLASSVISNIGDGIALAAGPLLVASLTQDPLLVSFTLLAQQLPNPLFGLPAGAIADRFDRRRIVAAVNLVRAAVRQHRPRQRNAA
jgi:Transmembrane secretion effector